MSPLLDLRDRPSRRLLLQGLAGGLVLSAGPAWAQPKIGGYPFSLGVAAGDPAPDGFVIWTRLAPRPLEIGYGMPARIVEVDWEVAADEGFRNIIRSGKDIARPELGHSVHAEVGGLEPARPYFYRFTVGGERSPVGRAKTTPAAGAPVQRVRFGIAGCQDYESGFYTAHRKLSEEDVDFVFCYGDYIYEGRSRALQDRTAKAARLHNQDEIYSLDDYRRRYAIYKLDPDLQASHASAAWFSVWDDHETDNNWVADIDQDGTEPAIFNLRRQMAVQAWYENMPVRRGALPRGTEIQIFRRASYGRLLELNLLDTRQYRTDQPCNDGWGKVCDELENPAAQVMGLRQEAWLLDGLSASQARWNVLAQQIMVMDLDRMPDPALYAVNSDSWAGYRNPRNRLLSALRKRKIGNPVVLTGDEHQNFAGELYLDGRNMVGDPIAAEFLTTSITSSGDGADEREDMMKIMAVNPQLKFTSSQRGYAICDVTERSWITEFKALDRVSTPGGTLRSRVKLALEPGSSRIQKA
ncbi:alkaline phosphatase D family protein [Caulobacter sp. NIBR2454]|uniref:alkaline phosphatase D family protein n=1 Tax=Caulobacter sp. NIBR2454 TaxID=3015996 RepID=UPI0022B6E32F|nr:alkaline phosphatase D family protein [Caulobacter sp. NIBR2454]